MLPFLKRKEDSGSVSAAPDHIRREPDDPSDAYDPLHAAADDLISAVHSKNTKDVAEALRAAFELCDFDYQPDGEQ